MESRELIRLYLIRLYLILRAQTGDEQAFEQIVCLYHSKLVYFLRRLISDESRVDDILQDVWLKVWRKLPTLQSPEAFPVWLYRIARNQAASEFRREPHTVPLEEDVTEEIAHVLGCQLGTVRSRIHYAKLQVRQLMEEPSHE